MKKILIIDPPSIPPIVHRSLGYLNYEVTETPYNDKTLNCILTTNPDLVLTPFSAQGRLGVDIARKIRQNSNPTIARTPVIMVSHEERVEVLVNQIRQSKQCNVNEFIVSPDRNIGLLMDRIALHISHKAESAWKELPPLPKAILSETLSTINTLSLMVEKSSLSAREVSQMKLNKSFKDEKYVQLNDGRAIFIEKLWTGFSIKNLDTITQNIGAQIIEQENNIDILLKALSDHDNYSFTHSIRVAVYLGLLLKYAHVGLTDFNTHLAQIITGALLHDVGHFTVDKNLLHKPGELSKNELKALQDHALATEKIISSQQGFSKLTVQTASAVHERLDGSGYPNKFNGDKLYPSARMISIVDAYDAMNSKAPYRKPLTPQQAFAELRASGNKFDQKVVDAFEELLHKVQKI